jgi:hypothetical protein
MVANLQYSGIVFAALYSLLLFGDNIPLIRLVAGMAPRRRQRHCSDRAAYPRRAQRPRRRTLKEPQEHEMYTTLISAEQLQALIVSEKKPLRIFDCTFELTQPQAGA